MTRHWLSIGLAFGVSLACAHAASAQVKLGVAGPITGGSATFGAQRKNVVDDKTTYGQGLADETRKTMNAKGLKEVLYEGVNIGDKDYSALVSKIKAARADLVYWGGLHDTGGLILRQLRDQGVKATFMGGDGMADDEFD